MLLLKSGVLSFVQNVDKELRNGGEGGPSRELSSTATGAVKVDSTGRRNTSNKEVFMGRPAGWMKQFYWQRMKRGGDPVTAISSKTCVAVSRRPGPTITPLPIG